MKGVAAREEATYIYSHPRISERQEKTIGRTDGGLASIIIIVQQTTDYALLTRLNPFEHHSSRKKSQFLLCVFLLCISIGDLSAKGSTLISWRGIMSWLVSTPISPELNISLKLISASP